MRKQNKYFPILLKILQSLMDEGEVYKRTLRSSNSVKRHKEVAISDVKVPSAYSKYVRINSKVVGFLIVNN